MKNSMQNIKTMLKTICNKSCKTICAICNTGWGRRWGISTGVCKSESLIVYLCRPLLRPPRSKQMHEFKIFFFLDPWFAQNLLRHYALLQQFSCWTFSRSASRLSKHSLKKISPSKAFLSGNYEYFGGRGYTNRGSATRRPPTNSDFIFRPVSLLPVFAFFLLRR